MWASFPLSAARLQQQPTKLPPVVRLMLFGLKCLMKIQIANHQANKEESSGDDVGQSEGKVLKEFDFAKNLWIFLGRIGQSPSKPRPKDRSYGPD